MYAVRPPAPKVPLGRRCATKRPCRRRLQPTSLATDLPLRMSRETLVQDLQAFQLPENFRGRPAWIVQLWWLVQATLFKLSPQVLYGWRRWLLRLFGAKIGRGVLLRPLVEITYPWK